MREVGPEGLRPVGGEPHGPHAQLLRILAQCRSERQPERRRARVERAGQPAQGGQQQQLEADHHRERIAGQAEDDPLVAQAAEGRATRLHGQPPEQLLDAERGQRRLDVVARADRHAAGGDDDVGRLERPRERLARRLRVVAHALDGHDDRAGLLAARGDENAVGLVDLAVEQGLSGLRRARRP